MGISATDRKLLWALSGGFCAKCERSLTDDAGKATAPIVLGEEAHIVSPKPGGPRFRVLPADEVDAYGNRILLCPEDHRRIDKRPIEYPEETLRTLKRDHEKWARQRAPLATELGIRDPHPEEPLALHHVTDGTELMDAFCDCLASRVHHPEPRTQDEADLISELLGQIHDWRDIWDDVGPGEQVRIKFELNGLVDALLEAGLVVYIGSKEKVLEGGIGRPVPWREALLHIYRVDDPLVALRPEPVASV